MIVLYILAAFFGNLLVGCVVCAEIDHRCNGRLLAWMKDAPLQMIGACVPMCWPVVLWFYFKYRED